MKLNPSQQEAVETLKGPLLVLAGAGSGKTRVVTLRIARLIQSGVAPERILAVTFTNKAAQEMKERVGETLGYGGKTSKYRNRGIRVRQPEVSTFHSQCVSILRRNITLLGYPSAYAIYDRGDQESVASRVLKEISTHEACLKVSDLLYYISRWKTASLRPDQARMYASNDKEHLAALAYVRYQRTLKAAGAVDFDDILLLTEELFTDYPEVCMAESGRFDHILVDEYQDTNQSQYRIIKSLALPHRNLCVVGDDDQSIYGWRGAEVTHILRFQQDWPDAKVVRLETNYRSTREIISWANRVVAFNRERHAKRLTATFSGETPRILQCSDPDDEALRVVTEIRQRIKDQRTRAGDIAILFRTNDQPRVFEAELRRQGVPYVIVGSSSFFDRKEIRDVLAYMRLMMNPRDEVSLLRVINTPPRGIGQTSVIRMVEKALELKKTLWEFLGDPSAHVELTDRVVQSIRMFREMIYSLRKQASHQSVDDVIKELVQRVEYRREIDRSYDKEEDRAEHWALVEELINAAAMYVQKEENPRLAEFVQQMALADRDMNADAEKEEQLRSNAVVLMTLHAAKGLEFSEVYMVGMEEGILPHKKSVKSEDEKNISEERRLCYVGITRAKYRLTLSLALTRMKWGVTRDTLPSRFLYEMTGQADNPNYIAVKQGRALTNVKKSADGK